MPPRMKKNENNPPTPWGPVCGSLVYLPPIILPPRRAENRNLSMIFSSPHAQAENFKRRKNREDSSDLDDFLTESIAAMKTRISKKLFGPFPSKTSRKLRETVVAGVSGGAVGAEN